MLSLYMRFRHLYIVLLAGIAGLAALVGFVITYADINIIAIPSITSSSTVRNQEYGEIFIKRVGSDLTTRTAPLGFAAYDNGYEATSSPKVIFKNILDGSHIANISTQTVP